MKLRGYLTDGVWNNVNEKSKLTFKQLSRQHTKVAVERQKNKVKKRHVKLTQEDLDMQIAEFKKQGGTITVIKSKFPDGVPRKSRSYGSSY